MILGRYSSERKKKVVVASAFALFNVNSAKQSAQDIDLGHYPRNVIACILICYVF